ncbi:MAG: 50S ribosomal protein L23 [Alphaproteobacteria bacterium MarineAlpha5_Bin9]|nr:MAG: 50S ribosomal protein L23 [Alphaproteobacteria bacterium MarineAlpha5_Bin9]|tara:strand:- start:414 stop:737 length:324 start_codon:yes stop_codon:yes gene_type:complete
MRKIYKNKDISDGKSINILEKPILTEKSTTLNQFNQYSFKVNLNSTSFEIRKAIEKLFKVKVSKINTLIVSGKAKSFKGNYGYQKNYKKAIVTLKEGQIIDSSQEIK